MINKVFFILTFLIFFSFTKHKRTWITPIKSTDIIKIIPFGYGKQYPILAPRKFNHGIKILAPKGTPIISPSSGTVVEVAMLKRGYGNFISISHNSRLQTRYAHLDSIFVKQGQIVETGQIIGSVGSTGTCVGPNLYFEVIKKGEKINPLEMINIEYKVAPSNQQ